MKAMIKTVTAGALGVAMSLALTPFAADAVRAETRGESAEFDSIRNGDLNTAEDRLEAALARGDADPFQLLNLAYVYQKTGREAEAARIYERIMEMDDNPLAALASGEPQRVKTIARRGLSMLDAPAE